MRARSAIFFLALLQGLSARAAVTLTPRFEVIQGKEEALAQRALLKSRLSADLGPFTLYAEGFAEGDAATDSAERRRARSSAHLQEAYLEFKMDPIFLRAGRQALRWSEMWVQPSLDIWTARRWNRLFFDPQPEQFIHSAGLSATYARETGSLEVFLTDQPARGEFPQPLPPTLEPLSKELSGGARAKIELGGFGLSALGARVGLKDWTGAAVNYAFDSVVPKFEIGQSVDRSGAPVTGRAREDFYALGFDIFWGSWTFQPQATFFDFGDLGLNSTDYQSIYYLSGTWQNDPHDLQFQTFGNTSSSDFFFSALYGYNFTDWFALSGFAQYYFGNDGGLMTLFHQITGGWTGGLRAEFNYSF